MQTGAGEASSIKAAFFIYYFLVLFMGWVAASC